MLTAPKTVNLGWVRAVCASLVKVPDESMTYRACVRGNELTISPSTIVAALSITAKMDYDYLFHSNH